MKECLCDDMTPEGMLRKARERSEKDRLALIRKKKSEGYKFWCYAPGYREMHKVYFRNMKSAESWLKKVKAKKGTEIHTL